MPKDPTHSIETESNDTVDVKKLAIKLTAMAITTAAAIAATSFAIKKIEEAQKP